MQEITDKEFEKLVDYVKTCMENCITANLNEEIRNELNRIRYLINTEHKNEKITYQHSLTININTLLLYLSELRTKNKRVRK